ncbi:U3 small nucleolar RNA-associated protein 18 homolog isoform X2 [Lingula anatina]|uniref:U3 small nucleolar RNA-associated protein 18 homolog n=1 Tax=Lingula anatina TaxID=7574 RepID=A0A1S3IXQ4_LINAN|nr:U3 small nucleolar RNA-associated protein 18 homolog isoform X2 [Lingula anatina]|eukprot:XP_013402329.1 U3 small nucleolar RNA-associated protein 18 homolog isoform X2 [Lingula anatina]
MLRRSLKRSAQNEASAAHQGTGTHASEVKKTAKVLGSSKDKDEAENVLEKLVLGGESEIVEKLQPKSAKTKPKSKDFTQEKKAAWEDEDDLTESVNLTKDRRHAVLSHGEKKITGDSFQQRLKNQFEKVSGTPAWARLKSGDEESDGAEDDPEAAQLLQTTGDYLAPSESLPKGVIQIKRCKDANSECPSQGKVKSVEFHPTAQVILTAGMDQRLHLFQVDGKNNPKIQSLFMDRFPIHTAHFSRTGEEVIMGSKHKNFYYYDMIAGNVGNIPQIKGIEENDMSRFEMSPDGKFIVFLGKYGHMHLISAKSKEWLSSLKMNGTVDSVTFSPDGRRMYSIGDEGDVYVWDMTTRDCIHRFKDEGCVQGTAITMSKNGQYLACGSYSGVVNIYDESYMNSGYPKPVKAIMNLVTPCTSAVFNSTSELMAITSNYAERAIKLVHFPSMTVFSNFPDKADSLRIPLAMDFSLNSGYFAVGNHRGQVLLYRVKHYGNY